MCPQYVCTRETHDGITQVDSTKETQKIPVIVGTILCNLIYLDLCIYYIYINLQPESTVPLEFCVESRFY